MKRSFVNECDDNKSIGNDKVQDSKFKQTIKTFKNKSKTRIFIQMVVKIYKGSWL